MTGRVLVNPYKRSHSAPPLLARAMGRQSQQRRSLANRTQDFASSTAGRKKKKKAGSQFTLNGKVSFVPEEDCIVCVAKSLKKQGTPVSVPHKPHNVWCPLNQKTKGLGPLTDQQIDNQRLEKLANDPPTEAEKGRAHEVTVENLERFFTPRPPPRRVPRSPMEDPLSPSNLCQLVTKLVTDSGFKDKHKNSSAPIAMLALADVMSEKVIRSKDPTMLFRHFDGITTTVPTCIGSKIEPHYHSIVGQKLLLVDWQRFGLRIPCPGASCSGFLDNDRTNFSKNRALFPIFSTDGLPNWCIVMAMKCTTCARRFNANTGDVLVKIPPYLSSLYPVDPKYALAGRTSHLSRAATDTFENIMLTYANGELCSRLLYNALNRSYLDRATSYYSYLKETSQESPIPFVSKSEFLTCYPPSGDTVREMYDDAASSLNNHWRISDNERHTREIQSVTCNKGIFAQDHTFQVVKNYQKSIGAAAVWDVATNTGEIASAVLVPSTQTRHFSHAAKQLAKRQSFTPSAMYSDTWPSKKEFWESVFPDIQGRLGLFHFEKRILSTLRKNHCDFLQAVTQLLECLYEYVPEDYENLLRALKDGNLTGKVVSDTDILDIEGTKYFRDRYSKYLRKRMRPPHSIKHKLESWFCRFKVTSVNGGPALGRLDPVKKISLFTMDTKNAVENCKDKAEHLEDPLPTDEMYDKIPPSSSSKHNLTEYISKRGESKLEAYHDRFQHFGNTGMRRTLIDNLNLCGTARYNLTIRHRRRRLTLAPENRTIPAGWERVVPYWNHAELHYINTLAAAVRIVPLFLDVESLPTDNGERFFSQYIAVQKNNIPRYRDDFCLCELCEKTPTRKEPSPRPPLPPPSPVDLNLNSDSPSPNRTPPVNDNAVAAARATNTQGVRDNALNTDRPTHNNNGQHLHAEHAPPPAPPQRLVNGYYLPVLAPFPPWYRPPTRPHYEGCCDRYREWMKRTGRSKGRPPHDSWCRYVNSIHGYSFG